MKTPLSFTAIVVSATLALGCGSEFSADPAAGAPGPGESSGSGTGSLRVSGHVDATESIDNSSEPSQFQLELSVEVWRGSEPVDDATVRIAPTGGQPIVLASAGADTALYLATAGGYHESYELDVMAGDDRVSGARIVGPDIHVFSQPTPAEVVAADQDLEIRWERSVPAEEAALETDEFTESVVPDEGSYTIDGEHFEGRTDRQEEDRAALRRTNYLTLDGGAAGSTFRVSVRNRVEFLIGVAP
ncbi:MAG: hypothetical protein JRI23_25375 [Deltaproteobacteria bacterium]|nr:hypothetical protein [Deltaproteobacteria bacterium]MBW2535350.1 hypothetical protein [Deltaproteobacteria bacterium]